MEQAVQIAAALLVLTAFVGAQFGMVRPHSLAYLLPNLVGSSVLAVQAFERLQWGFLVLESAWAVASVIAIGRRLAERR